VKRIGKRVVFILLGLIVVGGAAAGGFMAASSAAGSGLQVGPLKIAGSAQASAEAAPIATPTAEPAKGAPEGAIGIVYSLPERVVNLADAGGYRYLKIGVSIEFAPADPKYYELKGEAKTKADEEFTKELQPREPVMEDLLTTVLSAKTSQQVATPEGKEALRQELEEKLAKATGEPEVRNVYFTEFIIQ